MKHISNIEIMERFKEIESIRESQDVYTNERITRLQNQIVEDLAFLVHNTVQRYRRFPNYEDLIQEGFVGLVKATRRFDYTRYPNFFVYASQWILNGIRRSAKKYDVVYNPSKIKTVYCDAESFSQEPSEDDLDELLLRKEKVDRVVKAVSTLPTRECMIVKTLFGIDTKQQTLRQAEGKCGLTYERVRQIKNRVVEKLKGNSYLLDLGD